MMYTLTKKMSNISNCSLLNGKIAFVQDSYFHIGLQKFNILPMFYKIDVTNENIWIKDKKWENYLLNLSTSSLKKLDFNLGINGIITDIIICFKNNILSCYSVVEKKNIAYFPISESIKNYIRCDNGLLCQLENCIKLFSLFSGKYEWGVDLLSHGEIRNILGVVEHKLWISMYRGGISKSEKTLLSIDINNGDILFELPKDYTISDVHIQLLEKKQTILSIYSKWSTIPADSPFVEIDALTNEVLRSGRIESIYNENLKIASWQVLGNKIFFTANKDFLNATHIGVLDYDTLDLLWVTEVLDRKAGLKDLQVTEDKIYVLDMGGTLHIYEKI